jgi:hypothetical protein
MTDKILGKYNWKDRIPNYIKLEDTEINQKRKHRLSKLRIFNNLWKLLKEYSDKKWNFLYLSENPNITFDIIKNNLNIKWDYTWLSCNPNITWVKIFFYKKNIFKQLIKKNNIFFYNLGYNSK